jgi:hypothetical protein
MSPELARLTEEELDTLVSIAIRRAELLDDDDAPEAAGAWHEVMLYEEQLAKITSPSDVSGGVARAGAVWAALAAGRRRHAVRLKDKYLAEDGLPDERRSAIEETFEEDRNRRSKIFPALAKRGGLGEVDASAAVLDRQQDISLRFTRPERVSERPYSQYVPDSAGRIETGPPTT